MKKKVITMALALTLALSMTGTAFAAGEEGDETSTTNSVTWGSTDSIDNNTKTGQTEIDYTVNQSYTVNIPSDVSLNLDGNDYKGSGKVKATDVRIEDGKILKVTMKSTNAGEATGSDSYKLKYGTSTASEIAYSIKKGEDNLSNGGEVVSVSSGTVESGEVTLNFAATSTQVAEATKAGKHTDTLTFTVSVE
jgi:hypothetical protein